MKGENNIFVRFWRFLKKDTWPSFIVTLLIAFILIKFVLFPLLSLVTGTSLPLVIVESCSMYHHEDGFNKTFESPVYEGLGITLADTKDWIFQNGFAKGDVIFVVGAEDLEVGDVIIFNAGTTYPLIHRVVSINETTQTYSTKGDNYKTNPNQLLKEKSIAENQIVRKALFKVPAIGWLKLIFFEKSRPESERGFCK